MLVRTPEDGAAQVGRPGRPAQVSVKVRSRTLRSGAGQLHKEARPVARPVTLSPGLAAHGLGEGANDSEPDTGTTEIPTSGRIYPVGPSKTISSWSRVSPVPSSASGAKRSATARQTWVGPATFGSRCGPSLDQILRKACAVLDWNPSTGRSACTQATDHVADHAEERASQCPVAIPEPRLAI